MACDTTLLRAVPFFALFDDEELTVLAAQVDVRTFAARQRIYKAGDVPGKAYVLLSGAVRVTTIDEDQQDLAFDEPAAGDFLGFASLLVSGEPSGFRITKISAQDASAAMEFLLGELGRSGLSESFG